MGSQNTRPFLLPAERPSQRRPTKSSHGHFVSPQDAFQREMEIVKKSKDSVDERRAKDQAAAKVPYFIRKALGDVFDEISHADLVYACKALMDIDEENGKSWFARTGKKETRARTKRACKSSPRAPSSALKGSSQWSKFNYKNMDWCFFRELVWWLGESINQSINESTN